MMQVSGASGAMNGGAGEGQSGNVAIAADTAAVAEARTIDFTLDGKEGLFQVPHRPVVHFFFVIPMVLRALVLW